MSNHDPSQPRQAGRFAEKATPAGQRASAPPPTPAVTVATQELLDRARATCDAEYCVNVGHSYCTPDLVEPIAGYSLKITASHETRDGAAWTGVISLNGRQIIEVENSGTGGSNTYHPTPNMYQADPAAARAAINDWHAAAKAACPRVDFEQADTVVAFLDLANELSA